MSGIRCCRDAATAAIAGADLQGRQLFALRVAGLRFIRRSGCACSEVCACQLPGKSCNVRPARNSALVSWVESQRWP
jgi:hypothetical protein